MVDIKHKKCIESTCNKRPTFNFEGQLQAIYCSTHKLENMVDVANKKCIKCNKIPRYNIEGQQPLYCFEHKLNDMINVVSSICIELNCKTRPSFNFDGEKLALYCTSHKKDFMIDINHKLCINCNKTAIYNIEGNSSLYCFNHKTEGMINVTAKTCKTHLCQTQIGPKYEGYCLYCFINTFPDKPNTQNYKTKERSVVEYILENFPSFTWTTDKKVQDGCSKRRPDLLLDLGYQIIIIEVDENQHIDYDCSCENKRLMELSQDVGHRPIIFIRFNPDKYIDENGDDIASCWKITKPGLCIINSDALWNSRLNTLKNHVEYWSDITNKTDKTIEVIQLFYDLNSH
jgi:hypothetical protein